jgi:mannose-6-phosphate isomerase-like protein (cupin superfamily)
MAKPEKKNIATPDEARSVGKGELKLVSVGGVTVGYSVFQPGWHWEEHVKPIVGGDSCQVHHKTFVISGRLAVRMNDGTEMELGPGDLADIPAGHDGWVVGDEPMVGIDFSGEAINYAKG